MKKIIAAAGAAPSGENAQPWKFKVRGASLLLYNIPERDQSLYNSGQRGSWVAHGAAIENMRVAAVYLGYAIDIVLFPDASDPNLVAEMSFRKVDTLNEKEHSRYSAIFERCTNRKPYKKISLSPAIAHTLREYANNSQSRFLMTKDPELIQTLADAASINEYVMFNNKLLHNFFFTHILWDREREKEQPGFYIKTLEVPPPIQLLFRVLQWWPVMRMCNAVGLYKFIARQNAITYAHTSAMGVITIQNDSASDFIDAGRLMERVWLEATQLGLSIQPLTGVLFFKQVLMRDGAHAFSPDQSQKIYAAYENIKNAFNIGNETIALMFRIGYGDPPSARSSKISPQYEII